MNKLGSGELNALRLLNISASAYALTAVLFLVAFIVQFHTAQISNDPADWIDMVEMVGALFGPPLALWSVALVLNSIKLQQQQVSKQQEQYDEMLVRENLRLDPIIQKVVLAKESLWADGSFDGGRAFHLTVKGDAVWLCAQIPGRGAPAAIANRDDSVEVILWKKRSADNAYRAFLQYQRANGTAGWYWISVSLSHSDSNKGLGFVLARVTGPNEAEDGLQIEIADSE